MFTHLVCTDDFRFGGNQAERDAKAASGAAGAPAAAAGDKKASPAGAAAAAPGAKKGSSASPATAAAPAAKKKEPEGPPDVSRLDIRVGVLLVALIRFQAFIKYRIDPLNFSLHRSSCHQVPHTHTFPPLRSA